MHFTEGRSALFLGTLERLIRHAAGFVAFTQENTMDELLDPLPEPRRRRITQTHSIHRDAKQYALTTRSANKDCCLVFAQTRPGSRHVENLSVRLCAHHQSGLGQSRIVDGVLKNTMGRATFDHLI